MNNILNMSINDKGGDYYTIECTEDTFGRMYDHNATYLKISFPIFEKERQHECKLIFYEGMSDNSKILDQYPEAGQILKDGDIVAIKNTITQKRTCYIKFEFTNSENTYFKNTEIKKINFAFSVKPKDFNPTPENINKLIYLWKNSHSGKLVKEIDEMRKLKIYIFKNSSGEEIDRIEVPISTLPKIINIRFGHNGSPPKDSYHGSRPYSNLSRYREVIVEFDKPVPENSYLQIARYQRENSHTKRGTYRIKKTSSPRGWKIFSILNSSDEVKIPKGSISHTYTSDTIADKFRPSRIYSHRRNSCQSNRMNTNYYRFCCSTYVKGDYNQGELSDKQLVIKRFMLTPGGHEEYDDEHGEVFISMNLTD